jgi:hypothetical protein
MFIIYQHINKKWFKFILQLLTHVSVLIHHLQGFTFVVLAKVMNY